MENTQNSKVKTLLRVVVIVIIIIILILLSIGIVRVVPKILNSIANASLSMGSLLDTRSSTTTTQTGTNGTTNSTTTVTGTVATSTTGGFSIRDLTNLPTQGGNNYVPPAGGPSSNTSTNTNTNTNTGAGNSVSTTTVSNTTNTGTSNNSNTGNNSASTIGASDIAVEITSKGIIDKNTGRFVATNTFTSSDMIVVKFKIENRGQFATGIWSARVDMPSTNANDKVKLLNNNKSIPAGVAITGEARFNNGVAGSPNFSVAVDTGNSTQDTNRGNNTVSIPLNISNIGGNTNNTGNTGTNYPSYYGAADLQIRIISTGMVNQYGQYIANSFARYGEKAAVQFEVSNLGGTATGNWAWRADITGAAVNTYYSPTEASLAPGAATNFIVGFDTNNLANYNNGYNYGYTNQCNSGPYDIYTGQYIGYRYDCNTNSNGYNYGYTGSNSSGAMNFNIYLDTNNSVYEANENNNSASASVNVGY